MRTLRYSCIFLSLCGCWLPPSWTSSVKNLLYNLFTLTMWMILHTHVVAQILDIIINVENQDEFSENIYITPTILVSGCKMTSLVIHRKGILSLIKDLQTKPFLTVTKQEVRIQRRFNRIIERNAIVYMILVSTCVMWVSVRSFFTDFKDRKLTHRAWFPYDYSQQLSYTFTFVYQVMTSILTCFMNVGCDSLFSGFLIHIYSQFEILEERLKSVKQDKIDVAKQCAKHHYKIYKYAKRVNREFSVIMFLQFCVSSFTVCFNFYRMSQVTMVSLMIECVLYAACMLTEILYYCWYSNEVKLKPRATKRDIQKRLDIMGHKSNENIVKYHETCDEAHRIYQHPPGVSKPRVLHGEVNMEKSFVPPLYDRIEYPDGGHGNFPHFGHFSQRGQLRRSQKKFIRESYTALHLLLSVETFQFQLIYISRKPDEIAMTSVYNLKMSPPSWTSSIKKLLYNLFTLIVWLIVHTVVATQILDIIINVENQDDFSDNIYITPAVLVGGCKMTSLVIHRKGILSLIEDLQKKPFSTMTKEEVRIQRRFNRIIERNSIVYLILVLTCVVWISVRSFFTDFEDKKPTLRAWLPYDYSKQVSYAITYVYQVTTLTLTSVMNVGCDSLFGGLLIHIYSQFHILEERLNNVEQDKIYLAKQCARHHYKIYKYADRVNREFSVIMFLQFCVSAFTVCFNFYRMSQVTMVSLMVESVLYAACMLTEILYYCWYSNEVKLKSLELSDVIFRSDWTSWDTKARKILLTIMSRATEPIKFTSVHLVSLNLDSFMALMKTSYSMFNLLQHTKNP
ncbi:unnamed protein product [Xylocopa violacea]|uniref:Uncharacterized protein n=1 Tax=Xylocopa violacea TaxID=135666 RepID=A0ABP1PCR5_XYLVO